MGREDGDFVNGILSDPTLHEAGMGEDFDGDRPVSGVAMVD